MNWQPNAPRCTRQRRRHSARVIRGWVRSFNTPDVRRPFWLTQIPCSKRQRCSSPSTRILIETIVQSYCISRNQSILSDLNPSNQVRPNPSIELWLNLIMEFIHVVQLVSLQFLCWLLIWKKNVHLIPSFNLSFKCLYWRITSKRKWICYGGKKEWECFIMLLY